MTDVVPVGVENLSDPDPVPNHDSKLPNGKVLDDPSAKGLNGKGVEREAKDGSEQGSEATETDDSHDIAESHALGDHHDDERNGGGPQVYAQDEEEEDAPTSEPEMNGPEYGQPHDDPLASEEEKEPVAAGYVNETEYVSLLIAQAMEQEATNERLLRFKRRVSGGLYALREESVAAGERLRNLQSRYNQVMQDMRRVQREKERALKDKDAQRMKADKKLNELRNEVQRTKNSVNKIKDNGKEAVLKVQRQLDALRAEKEKLQLKIKRTEELVEKERKDKLNVTSNNQQYLREEKSKISKALLKEQGARRDLEDEVVRLREEAESGAAERSSSVQKYHLAERKRKQEVLRAERACKERDEAVQSLQRNQILRKQHEAALEEKTRALNMLRAQHKQQQSDIVELEERVRTKSEFEEEYSAHKERLEERERTLKDRERNVERRSKKSQNRRKTESPSKRSIRSEQKEESKDPLHHIRNLLPFHWVSVFLLILLMISIAQKR